MADIYFSSLLLHHLDDQQVVQMFRLHARLSRLGFVHFDLQRSFFHFYLAKLRIGLARLHYINQIDALRSIQQSYTRADLMVLLRASALASFKLRWSFPFRWLAVWRS